METGGGVGEKCIWGGGVWLGDRHDLPPKWYPPPFSSKTSLSIELCTSSETEHAVVCTTASSKMISLPTLCLCLLKTFAAAYISYSAQRQSMKAWAASWSRAPPSSSAAKVWGRWRFWGWLAGNKSQVIRHCAGPGCRRIAAALSNDSHTFPYLCSNLIPDFAPNNPRWSRVDPPKLQDVSVALERNPLRGYLEYWNFETYAEIRESLTSQISRGQQVQRNSLNNQRGSDTDY